MREYERIEQQYQDGNLPLPENWGGYRVMPDEFEFWQGGANRLHDRFRYSRRGGGWVVDRLAP
jgi:pyridoxamine 5'-phosphate oxidase